MSINKQFVAYYRISKDSHDSGKSKSKGLGLEAQKCIVDHFYKEDIAMEFTETKSAKNITERPVLQEAIDYCLKNDMWLVVAKLDRLSRNTMDVLTIVKKLNRRIIFCDIPSEGEADEFMITIFAALAQREREIISLRTSQALQVKIKREGFWRKNSPKWDDFKKRMMDSGEMSRLASIAHTAKAASNENTIRASQLIMAKIKEGKTLKEVADVLNANKFLTPNGKQFNPIQVSRIYDRMVALEKEKTISDAGTISAV